LDHGTDQEQTLVQLQSRPWYRQFDICKQHVLATRCWTNALG